MRLRLLSSALGLSLALAAPAFAQGTTPSGSIPPRDPYYPIFGITAGIAIPVAAIAEDHAAGYAVGGLVEYNVTGQPFALRGEALYQRFALKTGHAGSDLGLTSLGATIVYKMEETPTNTFLTGGIAIYHGTDLGTRPGVNAGAGIEIPFTGFSATGEARLHVMLADGRPAMSVPLTIGIRF